MLQMPEKILTLVSIEYSGRVCLFVLLSQQNSAMTRGITAGVIQAQPDSMTL